MATAPTSNRASRWPRFRRTFRVRTLMLLVLATAVGLGEWGEARRRLAVWTLTNRLAVFLRIYKGSDQDRTDPREPARNVLYQSVARIKALRVESSAVAALVRVLRTSRPMRNPISSPETMRDYLTTRSAIIALLWFGPEAKAAAPELIRTMKEAHDVEVQTLAAHALGFLGQDDPATIPALTEALSYRDPKGKHVGLRFGFISEGGTVAQAAATALGRFGPRAKPAVPKLIAALGSDIENLRISALGALFRIGPDAQEAVPALIALLDEKDPKPLSDPMHGAILGSAA